MDFSIFDMETDGLIDTVTRIHCVSVIQFRNGVIKKFSMTDPNEMKEFFLTEEILVGHNIIRFDVPVIKKMLGITPKGRLIDSLGLSWYLYPNRLVHGLESWGEDLGVPKPKIADWSNLSAEEYIFRCESDTEINRLLFDLQMEYLLQIYEGDKDKALRLIGYLMFKLDCAREQEEMKWKLDVAKCTEGLEFLKQELQNRVETLKLIMPKVVKYKDVARPKTLMKKDGTPSVAGQKWLDLLQERGYPEYHLGTIKVAVSEETGNPGSHAQLKAWLFSLGWIPETFKYVKEPDGSQRKIPQLSDEGNICESVKKLYEILPSLEHLEGLFIVRHRIGLLEGFLENKDKSDFLIAAVKGFTNTLRFQHTTIVNLPTIPKLYWERIRGCLIAPDDNYELCGSDMSGLEDNTKRHYMYYYDPDYVKEMMVKGFDPHLDIAILSKSMSYDEGEFFKWYEKKVRGESYTYRPSLIGLTTEGSLLEGKRSFQELITLPDDIQTKLYKVLKAQRLKSKKVNFAGVYGAGPPKISLTAGISLAEAKLLHTIYWKRNWSVKKVAESCIIKTIGGQMWLFNPVSQFWYSLRVEKDKFSTLNQGTGVYCFDTWVRNIRKQDVKICGQFHDEVIIPNLKTDREILSQKLRNAIVATNGELQLNVELGISIDYGHSYADIH